MRDPARIDLILSTLQRVWEEMPDLRLGQLLVGAVNPKESCPEIFNVEDDVLLQRLLHFH